MVGAVAIEATGGQAREARNTGSRALELTPRRGGGLRVIATPWAHVRVDGQEVETTPFARPIPLSEGTHWVTLSHPEAIAPIEREVTIVAGEVLTVDVTMNMGEGDAGRDAQ